MWLRKGKGGLPVIAADLLQLVLTPTTPVLSELFLDTIPYSCFEAGTGQLAATP